MPKFEEPVSISSPNGGVVLDVAHNGVSTFTVDVNGWFGGAHTVSYGAAPPAGGAQRLGDIRWNSAPAAGGVPGWVCVTAGTPGTWKAMAALAA